MTDDQRLVITNILGPCLDEWKIVVQRESGMRELVVLTPNDLDADRTSMRNKIIHGQVIVMQRENIDRNFSMLQLTLMRWRVQREAAVLGALPVDRHKPLARMELLVALLPVPRLRTKLCKLVSDEQSEILELYTKGHDRTARWRERSAWIVAVWYVVENPMVTLALYIIRKMNIGGP